MCERMHAPVLHRHPLPHPLDDTSRLLPPLLQAFQIRAAPAYYLSIVLAPVLRRLLVRVHVMIEEEFI